jgi:alpha-beta hydrolase superfamily lysophospholipase
VRFTAETSSNGVVERDFTVGEVPGVLWSPTSGPDRAPLVLMGRGGGQHKRAPGLVGRAHRFVTNCGFTVATIDAPGHGGRPRTATGEREITALRQAMAAGEPVGPIVVRYNAHLAERAVPEWQATLDALQELLEIGAEGPVGHSGVNMGTAIGVPLTAREPRITGLT